MTVCLGRKEVRERPCISNAGYGMIRRSELRKSLGGNYEGYTG